MSGFKISTIDKLSEENHEWWFEEMKNLLILGALWYGFVEDPLAPSHADFSKEKNGQCMAYISLNIAKHHYAEIKQIKTAAKLWSTLTDKYVARGAAAKSDLLQQLTNFARADGESVSKLVARARALYQRLQAAGSKTEEEQVVISLVNALPQEYHADRVVFMNGSAITFDAADVAFRNAEMNLALQDASGTSGFLAMSAIRGRPGNLRCYNCNKSGHLARSCPDPVRSDRAPAPQQQALPSARVLRCDWIRGAMH
jgi:hypothetical protein